MCPYRKSHYYEWMLTINNEFARLVADDKDAVLERLRSDDDLATLAAALGIVSAPDEPFAAFLGGIPEQQQRRIKQELAAVVEVDGPVYFDAWPAGVDGSWNVVPYAFDGSTGPADGMVLVLVGPWDLVPTLT
jgi:hypothetical protein